jgi:hypothetical protein
MDIYGVSSKGDSEFGTNPNVIHRVEKKKKI